MSTRPVAVAVAAARPKAILAPELLPGSKLGRYELLASLGVGGMGQVWLAEQSGELGFRKLVALKVIRAEHAANGEVRKMFLDEAKIASRIRHANVVEVLDLGEQGAQLFQAMTFVEGGSLGALLIATKAAPPFGIAIRIVIDALRGLHAAHELRDEDGVLLDVVHRDVSPQNILVGVDGVSKITDFGIVKALGRATESTQVGQWKGKLRYVAPEQIAGKPATRAGDIFSSGAVLWEALAGELLFPTTARLSEVVRARDLREVAPRVPARIAAVAMRALAHDPKERFPSVAEMADALEAAATDAKCLATHAEVASVVADAMEEALADLRDVMRARRRGEPLPEVRAPAGTVVSGVHGRARPAPLPTPVPTPVPAAPPATKAPTVPPRRRSFTRIALLVAIGACAAGALLAWGTHSPQTAAAPEPSPPGSSSLVVPNEGTVVPHVDSPDMLPRAPAKSGPAVAPRRKERSPAPKTTTPATRPGRDAPGDHPTFDNPYE